jgi:hypothetical protein
MTLEKARELLSVQVTLAGGYNRNAVRMILGDIQREHGQQRVDQLIREFDLTSHFGIDPGSDLSRFGMWSG